LRHRRLSRPTGLRPRRFDRPIVGALDGSRDHGPGNWLSACWSVPIMSGSGKVLGTFAVYHREPRAPTETERNLIAEATRSAAFLFGRSMTAAAPKIGDGILRG
jgi:GAF domain-containing protein